MKLLRRKTGYENPPHHGKDGFNPASPPNAASGGASGMQALSLFKGGALIGFVLVPHGEDHTHPDIRQGADGHAMAFALRPFALIILVGPRLLSRAQPGKVVQGVAQRLDTRKALMDC